MVTKSLNILRGSVWPVFFVMMSLLLIGAGKTSGNTSGTNDFLALGRGPIELVPWEKLADFIIDISGWNKKGDLEGFQVEVPSKSQVVQRFVAETGKRSLEIHIYDSAESMMLLMPVKMMMQDRKAPDGYTEKITVNGFPGVKTYDNSRKEAGLIVLILDRFVFQVFGHNFASEEVSELEEIAENHDIEGIANLGK